MRQRASGRERWAAGRLAQAVLALGVLIGLAAMTAGSAQTASAGASGNLKQKCAADIFNQPQILKNEMNLPGKKAQSIFIKLGFGEVDPSCDGHFLRLAWVMPQLVRHGHVINEDPAWTPFTFRRNGNDRTQPSILDFNSAQDPKRYWRPGDKARFKLRLQALSLATKKIVATSVTTHPMKVVTRDKN